MSVPSTQSMGRDTVAGDGDFVCLAANQPPMRPLLSFEGSTMVDNAFAIRAETGDQQLAAEWIPAQRVAGVIGHPRFRPHPNQGNSVDP